MNVYREKLRLRHHQCGADCKLKLKSIFDLFQDAAAEHADILGCGMENMLEHKTLWVLSRQKIEITRLPGVGEEVTVETYPCGMERLFAIREYRIYDGDGKLIINGTAAWLILDMDTIRPKRLTPELLALVPDNSNLPVSFRALGKIGCAPQENDLRFTCCVRASDIDMNRHLNNANYAAMIQDALATEDITMQNISTVEINYLHSGQTGEEISVHLQNSSDCVTVYGLCGEKSAFTSNVTVK
ncbi:MAG: hypothetical protein IKC77_08425 [Lentisphaeria bacterium]|nr:hypothetical protein [Lentisphaeria bacterium]